MRTVPTRTGTHIPVFGLGTWRMGERDDRRRPEIDALRTGLDLGVTMIDTAEMYGGGGAERVVGEAIRGRRDDAFLVTKVLPENASRKGTIEALERSLRNLGTDRVDLYVLHWPGRHPLEETFEAFERLRDDGRIGDYGVSNFDLCDVRNATRLPAGAGIAANQVLYNVQRRGIERRLLPWCVGQSIPIMAYSPLEQGRLGPAASLGRVAARHEATPQQVALAWVLRHDGVVTIPKSSRSERVRENLAALDLELTREDLIDLDHDYPAPAGDVALEVL